MQFTKVSSSGLEAERSLALYSKRKSTAQRASFLLAFIGTEHSEGHSRRKKLTTIICIVQRSVAMQQYTDDSREACFLRFVYWQVKLAVTCLSAMQYIAENKGAGYAALAEPSGSDPPLST